MALRTSAGTGVRISPASILQAQHMLQAQQQEIDTLRAEVTAMTLQGGSAPQPRIPASAAPEKCEAEMSPAAFRSWQRSMECWLKLCKLKPSESVHHIRLHCVPVLQRALDSRYSEAQWSALKAVQAFDAIKQLVVKAANQAVQWLNFFELVQEPSESFNDFFIRCTQKATDCAFKCPSCDHDLAEYMLLRKLMVGLSDKDLKKEVFQACEFIKDTDSLRVMCSAFEGARDDALRSKSWLGGSPRAAPIEVCDEQPDVAAAVTPRHFSDNKSAPVKMQSRPCGNCGGRHALGWSSCPARNMVCHGCGKTGHMKKCCRGRSFKKNVSGLAVESDIASAVAAIVVAAEARLLNGPSPQPTIDVEVGGANAGESYCVKAVPDTGAQVCVAGPAILAKLKVEPAKLRWRRGLRDFANIQMKCLGSMLCSISFNGRCSTREVYFMKSSIDFYLSLDTCKDLGLVPDEFPNHTPKLSHAPTAASAASSDSSQPERPSVIPFPPSDANIARLEEWLLAHFSSTAFNTAREPLPVMEGKPHRIHIMPDAVPYACHTPLNVPKHWEKEVKTQLEEDVKRGVLQRAPPGEATDWCSRMVVVSKKSGQPRRTVDFQRLNASCKRETHHTPTPFDMVSSVPLCSYKSVADAYWGFHQVELDKESIPLTTFITPWGRYQYRRTPMGHCSASDAYTRRFDDAIEDIPRKFKCIDDTLLYDSSVEEAFWHVYDFLSVCSSKGITLKPEKFKFCRKEVEFVGFDVGWDSYKPSEDCLSAIKNFTMPQKPTITDIRSWYGFVNQLAPFLTTAPVMTCFRDLLKKPLGKQVYWDEHLQEKFRQVQDIVCKLAKDGLTYYDKARPTVAVTDWSKEGVGFVILQQYCSCTSIDTPFCCRDGWKIALCGSRFLTPAESGYVAVEGEALAVVWCLQKARLFLLGCPNLTIITDHRPLVKLLGNRSLGDITNPRLFRLKERTLQYNFQIKYLPGKKNHAADFLSRFPALKNTPGIQDHGLNEDVAVAVVSAITENLLEQCTLDEKTVEEAALEDPTYQLLVSRVNAGDWNPRKSQEIACLRPFYGVRDRLSTTGDLVTYCFDNGCIRLVIPEGLRRQVTAHLHSGHQGLDTMLRRARHSVYWPGIEGDLHYHRSQCTSCERHSPSLPAEVMEMTPAPEYPFQQTVMDLFQLEGHMYLAYCDRLTGWLEIAHFPNGTSSTKVMTKLRSYFIRWGAPEQLSTDGGTNLVSEEMMAFYRRWKVDIRLSSAHYPQSNGRAEAAVKSAKRIIRSCISGTGSLDNDKVTLAMLQYLNTPLRDVNKSPAQLATGRQLRDGVPTARLNYLVDRHWKKAIRKRERHVAEKNRETVEKGPDRRFKPIQPGTQVRIQNQMTKVWDRVGIVVEQRPYRQYLVKLDGSGRSSVRNRRHLKIIRQPVLEAPATPIREEREEGSKQSTPTPNVRPARKREAPAWMNDYI